MKLIIILVSMLVGSLLIPNAVSAIENTFAGCEDTGFIPPCINRDGSRQYWCDDPEYQANPLEGGCTIRDDDGQGDEDAFPDILADTVNEDQPEEYGGLSDEEMWNSVTSNGAAMPGSEMQDKVRILVYIDVLTADNDPSFVGDARVCIETKGGIHGDAAECDEEGIRTAANMTTYVPFAITTHEDDEGVFLPEGREFFACVEVDNNASNEHIHSCAPSKNEGQDVIGVHIPLSH